MISKTFVAAVLVALLGGCVSESTTTEAIDEVHKGGIYCEGDCWCPQGFVCDLPSRRCEGIVDFSPPPPGALCGADCQCGYGEVCERSRNARYGHCAAGEGACTTHCDCPRGTVCAEGRCSPDFGPHASCYCDNHCGSDEVCQSGHCVTPRGNGRDWRWEVGGTDLEF